MLSRFTAAVALASSLIVVPQANADGRRSEDTLVNLAVDATATASAATVDHPPAFATDGNAATAWCPSATPASLTIDLGRIEDVSGFGISLAGAVPTGTVELSAAIWPNAFGPVFRPVTISTG